MAPAPAPLSRRARRAQTGEQPIVPPIAEIAPAGPESIAHESESPTAAAPALLLDPVLAPAGPFELLEPAAVAVVGDVPATPEMRFDGVAEASAPASAQPSLAETFAKLLAAEAMAAAPAEVALSEVPGEEPAPEEGPGAERVEPSTGPISAPAAPGVDEFEAASRLFSFTGETPVQGETRGDAEAATSNPDDTADAPGAGGRSHVASRRMKSSAGASFRRVAAASFSLGVFGIVGLMTVGMTTPAEAVAAVTGADSSLAALAPAENSVAELDEDEIQAYVAPADVERGVLQRSENYGTTTTAEIASEAGIENFSNLFRNDPNSNVQWPFSVGVTMSYGFGMRSGRMHQGVDFTPGAGSPIQAIADGTVRIATEAGGAFGVQVIIDHVVDGKVFSSSYAHMQYGSLQVTPGQRVTVGTVLGRTGSTGRAYGANMHFEILDGGAIPIDPMAWLREYTDGTHTVG